MASNNTELTYEWLLTTINGWITNTGGAKGYSIKTKESNRVYITCPHSTTDSATLYMEIQDNSIVMWSDETRIQTILQTSGILDSLETNISIQNTLDMLAMNLSKTQTHIIDTIIIDDNGNTNVKPICHSGAH